MYALCVEVSHARGMGHFYRALNLGAALSAAGERWTLYLNDHAPSRKILDDRRVSYTTVDLTDFASDWEGDAIARDDVRVWIDDRLDTDARHARRVVDRGVRLVTFDDRGSGAELADVHIAALAFEDGESLKGRRVHTGVEWLVLNAEIAAHRRERTSADRMIVTLGGSDTYGVTVTVVRALRDAGRAATVVVGPSFAHDRELREAATPDFEIKRGVSSLVAEFERHDLAITGGGITPFEANASGLPCIVIANEWFEVPVGRELARLGGSVFAGHYSEMDVRCLTAPLPVEAMSRAGLERIPLDGAQRIVAELRAL